MKKKGWIVWTWGKMGGLMVFMGVMVMMLTAYSFIGSSMRASEATRLAQSIRNTALDTYNSAGAMSFEYALPQSLGGEPYSIELLDKGTIAAILVEAKSGYRDVFGAASLGVPFSEASFGMLKPMGTAPASLCITKHEGLLYIETSRCT